MDDKTVHIIGDSNSLIYGAIQYYLEKNEWEFASSEKANNLVLIDSSEVPSQNPDYIRVISITWDIPAPLDFPNSLSITVEADQVLKQDTEEFKRYAFERGELYPLNETVLNFLNGNSDYLKDSIIDLRMVNKNDDNYLITFESLNQSYRFLNRKNNETKKQRFVEVLKTHVHDDSDNEIRYLTQRLKQARNGVDMIEILVGTEEEFNILEKNYFYKEFKKNISPKYQLYFIDKAVLQKSDKDLFEKIHLGFCLYDDCIYFDYDSNPNSLGYVDLNKSIREDYKEVFEKLVKVSNKITN